MTIIRSVSLCKKPLLVLEIVGFLCVAISAFFPSSFLTILGLGIIFWGAILIYVTPSKNVPLSYVTASTIINANNIERVLQELNLNEKGIYLPPGNLKDVESTLVFIPDAPNQNLPRPEETGPDKLFSKKRTGLLLTAPGLALSKLFERELGVSFTKTDLFYVQSKLPNVLVEKMGICESAEILFQNNRISVEINGNIFREDCVQTSKFVRAHEILGCLFSSSIACVLAKATGKAIKIETEEHSENEKTTRIEFQIVEE